MRSLLAVICLLFSLSTQAAAVRDSVGVENNNGKLIIVHKVAPKESYYSIGRTYNVPPREIIELNGNKTLQIGSLVKVPTQRPFAAPSKPATTGAKPASDGFITYKVGPKETLYAIAKRFNTTVENIKSINNLTSNSLSVGQMIKVQQGRTALPEPEPARTTTEPVAEASAPDPDAEERAKPKIPANRLGLTQRNERGVAVWIADENLDGTKMMALHRTAPIGTIVKITNPMTDRTTYAKVVGKFTENETTKDVVIVVTKATADLLGALDKRFQVSIDYGAPAEAEDE
ncbi:LysM peptidoglycan-binding domain-containing protein [Pedobacter sp. SYSU D00535]|uniref:LysM peptidoglycan-binding domain-containing protein n=1 Tax=Pedobacter sp. SYSU D00535 TaxID=2810308 RepID=UPI001A95BBC5|nr:LysM peptidoglycan-binding domain-containing protein [Pedobacter sp. SYSU D00535]